MKKDERQILPLAMPTIIATEARLNQPPQEEYNATTEDFPDGPANQSLELDLYSKEHHIERHGCLSDSIQCIKEPL